MAVESAKFQKVSQEKVLPPGDLVTGHATLEQLKVPEEVLLRPETVGPFLANQWKNLQDEVIKPNEIKTMEADIPEYNHQENAVFKSALTADEEVTLQMMYDGESSGDLSQGQAGLAATAASPTPGVDVDQLDEDIEAYLDEIVKNHPELLQGTGSGSTYGSVDALEQMMMGNMLQETEEQRRKFHELIAAARSPEMVNAILGFRQSQLLSQRMGKLVESYKFHVDALDKLSAQFDLTNSKGNLSQADLAKFNMDFARAQTDSTNLFQLIQKTMTDYERIITSTSTNNKPIAQTLDTMIRNLRS